MPGRGGACMGAFPALRYDAGMHRVLSFALAVALLLLVAGAPAVAADSSVAVVEDAGAAARQAVDRTGGRVLDVQKRFIGERAVYVVKVLLHDGRVKLVEIEANPTSRPDFMEP